MFIRPESSQDVQQIWELNRAAFGSQDEADLVNRLRDGNYIDVSLVAVMEEQIVGHICFSQVTIRGKDNRWRATSLAPMAVLPDRQRQGIGSSLVRDGLEACRQQDLPFVVVLGHPEFYPRFGFSPDAAEPLTCPYGSGEAWMAQPLKHDGLAEVGGEVEYPPPFSSL